MRAITLSLLVQFVVGTLAFGDLGGWTVPATALSLGVTATATVLTARWGRTSARRWSAIGIGLWLILALSAWYDTSSGVAAPRIVIHAQRAALWAWFFCATTATLIGARDTRVVPVAMTVSLGVLASLIAGRVLGFSGYAGDLDPWTSLALHVAPAAFVGVPLGASLVLARYGAPRSGLAEGAERSVT